jgi:thymidylate synthase ThyX
MALHYPRFIHSEFLTHRLFSRNSASSRAIPVSKLVQSIRADPAEPITLGRNQPGMQASEQTVADPLMVRQLWRQSMEHACNTALELVDQGLHKQHVNRVLEPYVHMDTLVTATEWSNFFELRLHNDAQPEMQRLAQVMKVAMEESTPDETYDHEPFRGDDGDWDVAVARCCRISYGHVGGGNSTPEQDRALAQRLRDSGHWSPFEHVATYREGQHDNYNGWVSYRRLIKEDKA